MTNLAIYLAVVTILCCGCAAISPITLRADQATLHDLSLATTRPDFTGAGYATGFTNHTGEIEWDFTSPQAGVYEMLIRYSAAGEKGYELTLNDTGYDGMLPTSPELFSMHSAGRVEIVKGANMLKLGHGWGHYEIDSIELRPSKPFDRVKPIEPKLVDAQATPATRELVEKLIHNYGQHTFTGVIKDGDREYVKSTAGVVPTIMGGDLIEYSPSRTKHGSDPKHETERLIAAAHAGHIVTLCWHWNAPTDLIDKKEYIDEHGKKVEAAWWFGFYSRATKFDFADALDHPDSANYALLLRDIDTIAVELKKLDEAGVPVLWRPLHESDGKWFWWGTRGPDHFKQLWRLVFDRLVNHHHLHNLIWVYTWNDPAWYPGDDVVDVVGIDAYPKRLNDPLTQKWSEAIAHFDGRKLIALSEFGTTPDLERMWRLGVTWSYFVSWTGEQGPRKGSVEQLKSTYHSPAAINLLDR